MSTQNYAPEGLAGSISSTQGKTSGASAYQAHTAHVSELIARKAGTWDGISAEAVARMRLQNRFLTGLDIARYTAGVMRADMAAYDADP